MKEEDFRAILALHKHQNLTKAANELYIGQPALSKQLHRIEQELDVSIAERNNRGVKFTQEGEYLVKRSVVVLELIEETKAKLIEIKNKN